ncbi:hypothetical protein SAMN02745203_00389 [Porphyromonas crevioricanis]|nr:hypothetical protein SAMN02745203_00389 [Porphyromonas crevioricanis]
MLLITIPTLVITVYGWKYYEEIIAFINSVVVPTLDNGKFIEFIIDNKSTFYKLIIEIRRVFSKEEILLSLSKF